MFTASAL